MIQEVTEKPPEPVSEVKEIFEPKIRPLRQLLEDIVMRNGASSFRTVNKGKSMMFKASLYDINKAIEGKHLTEHHLEEIVPEQYHEFHPLFNKVLVDSFTQHRRGIDHEVRLKDREIPRWGQYYSMSSTALVVSIE
jgi:hypothetical protein